MRGRLAGDPRRRAGEAIEIVDADVANVAFAAKRHGDVELPAQDVENARHAGFSASPKSPKKRSSDEGGSRSQSNRLEDVLPRVDASIDVDLSLVADRVDNGGQRR